MGPDPPEEGCNALEFSAEDVRLTWPLTRSSGLLVYLGGEDLKKPTRRSFPFLCVLVEGLVEEEPQRGCDHGGVEGDLVGRFAVPLVGGEE